MKVYIVRSIETKAFEGLFWAERLADLWDTFDQFGDPYGYEYALIRTPGALCVGSGPGVAVKQWEDTPDDEDVEDIDWRGFQADEMFSEALYRQSSLKWKPFCACDQDYGLLARIAREVEIRSAANDDNEVVANVA